MEALEVLKTYKLYINGKFPRTESGRYIKCKNKQGDLIANICHGSRKDFRNAVVAARKAQGAWASRSAYNRGQIIYRIAEMLEQRKFQFVSELELMDYSTPDAIAEIDKAIDRLVYYAGWSDKYQQIFSSVNPVASSHFNFSVLEPMGVVAVFAPASFGLLGLISTIIPAIIGGNTIVVLASEKYPICSISFAEVLHTSDVPNGVINVLTGKRAELIEHFSTHKDVNGIIYTGTRNAQWSKIRSNATENLKRVIHYNRSNWSTESGAGPYYIADVSEVKTTWHPIGA